MTKDEYDRASVEDKLTFHRVDVKNDNLILKLDDASLLQAEYETYGAMSILFHEFSPDPDGVESDALEDTQSKYYDYFVDAGWMPQPLRVFAQAETPATQFNAAGSMSGAFIEIARVRLGLPRELTEL